MLARRAGTQFDPVRPAGNIGIRHIEVVAGDGGPSGRHAECGRGAFDFPLSSLDAGFRQIKGDRSFHFFDHHPGILLQPLDQRRKQNQDHHEDPDDDGENETLISIFHLIHHPDFFRCHVKRLDASVINGLFQGK